MTISENYGRLKLIVGKSPF